MPEWSARASFERVPLAPAPLSSPRKRGPHTLAPAQRCHPCESGDLPTSVPPSKDPRLRGNDRTAPASTRQRPTAGGHRAPGARRPVGWRHDSRATRFFAAKFLLPVIEARDYQSTGPPPTPPPPNVPPHRCHPRESGDLPGHHPHNKIPPVRGGQDGTGLHMAAPTGQAHRAPGARRPVGWRHDSRATCLIAAKHISPATEARDLQSASPPERSLGHCMAMPCRKAIARNRRGAVARPAPSALFGREGGRVGRCAP